MSINSFNSLLDKAISVANVAGKKTEEMVEASKLKIQEVSVNADLANCYEKIGSLVYSSKKFGADNEQEIAQLIAQADELLEQLAQVRKCPNCGASCATDAHFCSRCGMVLHEETSVVVPEEVQQSEVPEQEAPSEPEKQDEEPLIEEKL